jgi:hypothetical protein
VFSLVVLIVVLSSAFLLVAENIGAFGIRKGAAAKRLPTAQYATGEC